MGGLWKDMKLEAVLFLTGSAALAGVPGLAGFWSKDEIIGNVLVLAQYQGGVWWFVFGALLLTAGLTAFYTTRLVMLTFFGAPFDAHRHPHKTHWTMLLPLVVLATLSVVGGLALGSPVSHALDAFTEPVWTVPAWHHDIPHELEHGAHTMAMGASIAVATLGIGLAAFLYSSKRDALAAFVKGPGKPMFELSSNKFWVDEIYDFIIVQPTRKLADVLFVVVDRGVIDGALVEGSGRLVSGVGYALRLVHNGAVNTATTSMTLGAVLILAYLGWLVANG
jgi:NADH-quinone oxidoreductase subunit L